MQRHTNKQPELQNSLQESSTYQSKTRRMYRGSEVNLLGEGEVTMSASKHRGTHTHTHIHANTHTHTHSHTHTHTYRHTNTHTHTHSCLDTHNTQHTHTHTHTRLRTRVVRRVHSSFCLSGGSELGALLGLCLEHGTLNELRSVARRPCSSYLPACLSAGVLTRVVT